MEDSDQPMTGKSGARWLGSRRLSEYGWSSSQPTQDSNNNQPKQDNLGVIITLYNQMKSLMIANLSQLKQTEEDWLTDMASSRPTCLVFCLRSSHCREEKESIALVMRLIRESVASKSLFQR
ncbi:hypothetical protein [Streptococcus sp. E17BB]|uniref:hypothetical protein n=1 Tax=Streptococcus sp. E17BB TaxID=3278714 RepID=UPI00359EF2BE